MGIYDEVVEVPRRTMVLFFVVDTSGSMSGSKIGTVNEAIRNVESMLADISESNADARIKVATLAFSTGAQWITPAPVEAEKFRWEDLNPMGITDFGEACKKLNEKLSKNGFMCDATGSFAPAIFLMSDGEPTDNYKYGLDKLKQNNWFKKAIKVAIAIGKDANKKVLAEFTGTSEAVITVHTPEELKKWIKFVSVRASEVGSKSAKAQSSPITTGKKGGINLSKKGDSSADFANAAVATAAVAGATVAATGIATSDNLLSSDNLSSGSLSSNTLSSDSFANGPFTSSNTSNDSMSSGGLSSGSLSSGSLSSEGLSSEPMIESKQDLFVKEIQAEKASDSVAESSDWDSFGGADAW